MKIKYKNKLIKRAEHNAREDIQFIGDEYLTKVSNRPNSEPSSLGKPFLACAVGCLCLPITAADRKSFFAKRIGSYHDVLEREFGIPRWLSTEAEDHFTELEDRLLERGVSDAARTRRLGDFVIAFAQSVPEGYKFEEHYEDEEKRLYEEGKDFAASRRGFLQWLRVRDTKRAALATA